MVGAGITFSLGQWQLARADQKEQMQASLMSQRNKNPFDNSGLLSLPQPLGQIDHPVVLKGTWQVQATVFLDNRPMSGKVGFYVVTPLKLTGRDESVLVQRGWAPRNFLDRSNLPPVDTPAGEVTVSGRIAPSPGKLYEFRGVEQGRIRQNLDLAAFRAEWGVRLVPVSVVQTDAASGGLLRNWPEPATGAEKHWGYAFQWFGLCGLIVLLYVWFQIVRRFLIPSR
jgi:surfeit locus 1 family protein